MFAEWALAVVAAVAAACICVWVAKNVRDLWWQPLQIYRKLQAQGVKGPPFRAVVGNQPEYARMMAEAASRSPITPLSHEIVSHLLPYYKIWSKEYGDMFTYAFGSEVRLAITDPELMKEILGNRFGHFPKPPATPAGVDLLGENSLVLAAGEKWAQERRILNHGFHADKLKAKMETMAELTTKMLDEWEGRVVEAKEEHVEMEVHQQYQNLTADIIAHIGFGSSYEAGRRVFHLQYIQAKMAVEQAKSIPFPGSRLFNIVKYAHGRKIKRAIEKSLHEIIERRLHETSAKGERGHEDLLGVMISAYRGQLQKNVRMSIQDIVDECKTFYFAGHETTTSLLTWATMLLALHPSWQERVRAEVMSVCGSRHNNPTNDMLPQLKRMGNVLHETLRLYSPVLVMRRCTERDMKLGRGQQQQLLVPKGTVLTLLLIGMLHDKRVWGEDADTFNPDRFAEGVANASKHPSAFMAFSVGPRNCIGQVFALMEAKVVLCKLLQRFHWKLSSTYVHSPTQAGLLRPSFGMQIIATPIHA